MGGDIPPSQLGGCGAVVELYYNLWGGRKLWQVIASLENYFSSLPGPWCPSRSQICWQNLHALQFQYIVILANCNKASIKKLSADSLARNKNEKFGGRTCGERPGARAPSPPKSVAAFSWFSRYWRKVSFQPGESFDYFWWPVMATDHSDRWIRVSVSNCSSKTHRVCAKSMGQTYRGTNISLLSFCWWRIVKVLGIAIQLWQTLGPIIV